MTETTYDWRADMRKAGELKDRAATNTKQAGQRLWKACQAGIEEWLPNSDEDRGGEGLYNEFLEAYGEGRKGDCSKMKTVALAVKEHGLVLAAHDNLGKAYGEARRLMVTVQKETAEDEAAEKAVESIASSAPKSSSTPEGAALIVLSKGLDEAARLLLDALGAENDAAHRSLLRAISHEIAGRVKPKATTVKAGPKDGAVQATKASAGTKAKAEVKAVGTKPRQSAGQAAKKTAAATSEDEAPAKPRKATPVKRATAKQKAAAEALADKAAAKGLDTSAAPVKAEEPVEETDIFDEMLGDSEARQVIEAEQVEEAQPVKTGRATPVKRPVRAKTA